MIRWQYPFYQFCPSLTQTHPKRNMDRKKRKLSYWPIPQQLSCTTTEFQFNNSSVVSNNRDTIIGKEFQDKMCRQTNTAANSNSFFSFSWFSFSFAFSIVQDLSKNHFLHFKIRYHLISWFGRIVLMTAAQRNLGLEETNRPRRDEKIVVRRLQPLLFCSHCINENLAPKE